MDKFITISLVSTTFDGMRTLEDGVGVEGGESSNVTVKYESGVKNKSKSKQKKFKTLWCNS